MSEVKKTKFGSIAKANLPAIFCGACEIMTFEKQGSPHVHDRYEHILTIAGEGRVVVDGEHFNVSPGGLLIVEAGIEHYMIPDKGTTLVMLITYV